MKNQSSTIIFLLSLSLTLVGIGGGLQAQSCGYFPFPTFKVHASDTDPCATYVIRTDPYDPYNRQYLLKLNVFNWIDPNPDISTEYEEYCINSSETNTSHVKTPWSQDDNATISHFVESGDRYPKDGWELIKYDLGMAPNGQAAGVKVDFPYVILYNRFTGVLRVFYADNPQNQAYNIAKIKIRFDYNTFASSNLDISTAFTAETDGLGALKNFVSQAEFDTPARFVNGNMRWTYADFPMMYDPCVCHHEDMKMVVELGLTETHTVEAVITVNGSVSPDRSGSSPILNSSTQTYSDQNGQFSFGWKDLSGVNDALQKAAKSYKDLDKFRTSTSASADKSGFTADEKTDTKAAIADLTDALSLADFLKAGLKSVPYLSSALTFLDYFVAGGKNGESPSEPIKIHPMGIEMNGRFQGNIQSTFARKDITFYVPGTPKFLNMTNNQSESYPFYNQALGVFNLIETPTLSYTSSYVGSPMYTPTTYGPVYVVDEAIDPAWESWDPYLPHRHPEFDPNQFYAVDAYNHEVFGLHQDDPVRNYVFKVNGDIPYLVNPATEFRMSGSEVVAAIWVEVRKGTVPVGVGFLQNTNFNLFSEGKGIYRTAYVPLSCIDGLTAEFSISDGHEVNVYLKIIANFERGDQYALTSPDPDYSGPDAQGIYSTAQNVLWSGKFRVNLEEDREALEVGAPSNFINVPGEIIFTQNTTLAQDVIAYDKIIVGQNVLLSASTPVTLRAGSEIVFLSGASYSSNTTLQIGQPNGCTDYYTPTDKSQLATYCISPSYTNGRLVERRANPNEDEEQRRVVPAESPLTAQPNPFTDELTLKYVLVSYSRVQIVLVDLMGRTVREILPVKYLKAGPHEMTIDLSELAAGMYTLVMQAGEARQTVKVIKQ